MATIFVKNPSEEEKSEIITNLNSYNEETASGYTFTIVEDRDLIINIGEADEDETQSILDNLIEAEVLSEDDDLTLAHDEPEDCEDCGMPLDECECDGLEGEEDDE